MDGPAESHSLSVLLDAENATESDGTVSYQRFLARLGPYTRLTGCDVLQGCRGRKATGVYLYRSAAIGMW